MKTTQRTGMRGGYAFAGVLLISGMAMAATQSTPCANLTEKWSTDASGWSKIGDGSGLWTNGALGVSYAAAMLGFPMSEVTCLYASDAASGGRFLGNYIQQKITDVAFGIKKEAFTGTVYFYLNANNHQWRHEVALPSSDDAWGNVDIPMTYDSGWSVVPLSVEASEDLFQADLASVTGVGVCVSRGDSQIQGAMIENFKVIGPWGQIITSGASAGLSSSWLAENGLAANTDANAQPFNDGVTYLDKFVTGMDPNDALSKLTIDIDRNASGHAVLKWQGKAFRTYTIMQAPDLTGGQSFVAKVAGLQSSGTTSEVEVDEAGAGPYFYKIAVEQEVTQ